MKQLSKNQLQTFALIFSVIGLIGWEVFSPPGAAISCFIGFIALPVFAYNLVVGFERSASNKYYGKRLVLMWAACLVPFWVYYFGSSYFKQSLAFDIMLCFFILRKLNAKFVPSGELVAYIAGMMVLSLLLSSIPVLLELLVINLYYFRTNEQKFTRRRNLVIIILLYTVFAVACTFMKYNVFLCVAGLPWYCGLAPLGMLLVFPLTSNYSGEEGKIPVAHYFFYVVYPALYLILGILGFLRGFSYFYLFAGIQGVFVIISAVFMWYIGKSRLTGSIVCFTNMIQFAHLFFLGYFMAFTMKDTAARYLSFRIQIGGFFLIVASATLFAAGYCRIGFPRVLQRIVYYVNIVISIFVMVFPNDTNLIFTRFAPINTLYYPSDMVQYGQLLRIFVAYFAVLSFIQIIFCLHTIIKTDGAEKMRCIWLLFGIILPWVTFAMRRANLCGGYQIVNVGVLLCMVCDMIAMLHYGMTDPVQLASNSFLDHAVDGIMILDQSRRVVYFNEVVRNLIPTIAIYMDAEGIFDSGYEEIIAGEEQVIDIKKRSYRVTSEPLFEAGYLQGYIVRLADITAQIEELNAAKSIGYTDSLTKLYTRRYYELRIHDFFQKSNIGSFFYLDVDDFKHVNDDYSHETGDKVLRALGNALTEVAGGEYYTCRLGGDEFSMFLPNECRYNTVGTVAQRLIDEFHSQLIKEDLPRHITISIGIVTTDSVAEDASSPYKELYNKADAALYNSKRSGKNRFCFYKDGMKSEKEG